MILVWAALYFPAGNYEQEIAALEETLEQPREELDERKEELKELKTADPKDEEAIAAKKVEIAVLLKKFEPLNKKRMEWKEQSILGHIGHWIEPVVRPLGWDWKIGMAAIASFPAREVMVGTLSLIFGRGEGELDDAVYRDDLEQGLREASQDGAADRRVFTIPVAFSVMVFFALCCQCVSTLVIIKRETDSWRWPIFTFVYMTTLAYVGAFLTYQIGSLFS
jgi:ferrous iron transport protein B